MSSINKISPLGQRLRNALDSTAKNAVGVTVNAISPEKQLTRMVLASMLFEKQFYLDGKASTDIIKTLVPLVSVDFVENLAIAARTKFKLRHVPLFLARELARTSTLKSDVLANIISRADEMGEFLSLYWSEGKTPVSNQVKKGLAKAFVKFNEYQLAKNDKNSAAVSVRDVMFISHAKPTSPAQEALFKRVANQELVVPDTWETQLSAGADKGETFTRLMAEKKLGALAFLRNLRNMVQAGVDETAIRAYGNTVNVEKVLPFRYIAAARIVPQFEDMLEKMRLRSLATLEKLPGKTVLLVDVSGSMFGCKISAKSDLDRFDAAAALAMLCNEVCESVEIYTFSTGLVRVAPRSGFALRDALYKSQQHGGTNLGSSLRQLTSKHDRIIVFTDEQSHDRPAAPSCANGYIINVAGYENGVNHDAWTTVTGFSEVVIDYIRESEKV
jgi:hypothetical protein